MMSKSTGFRLKHFPVLDGLRGVSVLAVLAFHLDFLARGGFLGVDIFFVLSGFLITALLVQEKLDTGTIDFRSFYLRRSLRLFPALLTVISVVCIVVLAMPSNPGTWTTLKLVLPALYLSDFLQVHPALGHTWSLSIEEQFYVAWPAVLWVGLRFKFGRRWTLVALCSLVAAVAVNRTLIWKELYASTSLFPWRTYSYIDTRSDSLLVGCIVGLLLSYDLIPDRPWVRMLVKYAAVVSIAALVPQMLFIHQTSQFLNCGGYTVVAALTGVIIISFFVAPVKPLVRSLESPTLVWIGRLSYGIYLWQVLILKAMEATILPLPIRSYTIQLCFTFVLVMVASIGMAALSFYCIEKQFLRMKAKLHRTRQTGTIGEPSAEPCR